jgi:hypothetical protein
MVAGVARVPAMVSFTTAIGPAVSAQLPAALAQAAWWPSALLFPGVVVLGLVGRLLTGWQRRQVLSAVIGRTRDSTAIVPQRGCGGPAMRIEAGAGPDDPVIRAGPGCGRRWPTASLPRACIDTPPSKAAQSH